MEKNACLIFFFKRTFALWVFARVWQLFNWLFLLTRVLSTECNGSWGKFKYQFYVLIKAAIPQAAINCVANFIPAPEFLLLEFWTSGLHFCLLWGLQQLSRACSSRCTDRFLPCPQAKWKRPRRASAQPDLWCFWSSAGRQCRHGAAAGTRMGVLVTRGDRGGAAGIKGWVSITMDGV